MKIILCLTMFLTLSFAASRLDAQMWPFAPMFRFGNSVFYSIDSLSEKNLTGTNKYFDKKLTDRFFDVTIKSDSIGINISDSIIYFTHKNKIEPKCYQELIFYSKRNFINQNFKITYLKLIDSNDSLLTAQATILTKYDNNQKIKEILKIRKTDINGVILGTGKNSRRFYTTISITAVVSAMIITGLK